MVSNHTFNNSYRGRTYRFSIKRLCKLCNNANSIVIERQKFDLNLELERQKFKTNLIIEAVKTGDKAKAIENLSFFIEAGFIDDPDGRIKGLIDKNRLPVLPSAIDVGKLNKDYGITQSVVDKFIQILEEKGVPSEKRNEKLRELADKYRELQSALNAFMPAADPLASPLMKKIQDAIQNGDFSRADALLAETEASQLRGPVNSPPEAGSNRHP